MISRARARAQRAEAYGAPRAHCNARDSPQWKDPYLAKATPPLWGLACTQPVIAPGILGSGQAFSLGGPRLDQISSALGYPMCPEQLKRVVDAAAEKLAGFRYGANV
jgi:hypothetical protein